jgi:hypothetical protein
MTHELEQALKRPSDYASLSPRQQWDIDAKLGILDWNPSKKEADEFCRRWKEKVQNEEGT